MTESGDSIVEVPVLVALISDVALECDVIDAKPLLLKLNCAMTRESSRGSARQQSKLSCWKYKLQLYNICWWCDNTNKTLTVNGIEVVILESFHKEYYNHARNGSS